jgi:hypothetical protein
LRGYKYYKDNKEIGGNVRKWASKVLNLLENAEELQKERENAKAGEDDKIQVLDLKLKEDAKPFEKAQTIENNDFIVEYNNEIADDEKKQKRFLTKQEKIKIKNDMYKDFYSKTIKKITSDNFKNVLRSNCLRAAKYLAACKRENPTVRLIISSVLSVLL